MKIAIIGAGLAGRLLAWRLSENANNAIQISLFDKHSRDHIGTGLIAAAMVAPFTEAVTTDPVTQVLGRYSWQRWQQWLPDLESATGVRIPFNQSGTMVVAHSMDEADYRRFQQKANACIAPDDMQILRSKQIAEIEPDLPHSFKQALYFADEGALDNTQLYQAWNRYFDQSDSITWHENLEQHPAELDESFDIVFDCRGNDAKADLTNFRSVRGEVLRVYAPEVKLARNIRLMHPRYPLYIAPRENHEYVIGATQIESDAQTPVTVRSGLELLSALYSLHPGFAEAQILSMQSGLRPAFNDNLPRIIRNDRLISINGLFRHGYLFGPALIDDAMRLLQPASQSSVNFPQFIQHNTTVC